MIKVAFVIGTRPEGIKLAPIIKRCEENKLVIKPIVVVTSQHDELLHDVLKIFQIKPHFDLKVMTKRQTLFDVTAKILTRMRSVIEEINPSILIVQGDTTTALGAALSAYYKKIKVGHVEAGLRSFKKYNPFPEEINRKLISSIADIHFAPVDSARENLIREGVDKRDIFVVGNPVIDALYLILKKKWTNKLSTVDWRKRIILVTAHRRESFGRGLENISQAILKIAKCYPEVEIIFPVHPNPMVKNLIRQKLKGRRNIHLFAPFDYQTFVNVMKRATLILTDSGGIQEEAPSLGVPVLVMREVTERPEGVLAGCAKIVGTKSQRIFKETALLLNDKEEYKKMAVSINPYGDGQTSKRILKVLIDRYST